jgi:predicted RecB family nuclease
MYYKNKNLIFSATDLVTFLGCRHATFLDRRQLEEPAPLPAADPYLELLQQKGFEHERAYREKLRAQAREIVEIPGEGSLEERTERTRAAMAAGAEVIYQGAFFSGRWHGYADFLLKTPGPSALGDYHYEPVETKLAHGAKPKHVLQLAVYADLLAAVQARLPERFHILLGTGETVVLPTQDFQYYLAAARERFEAFGDALPTQSVGEPCQACALCRWRERCEEDWAAADHLNLVANIKGGQIEKLTAAGVTTLTQLAAVAADTRIPRVQPTTLEKLRGQARLQSLKRQDGQNRSEILTAEAGKGFARLPQPNAGDLFFDVEGDTLIHGGLEYLFGFAYQENGETFFHPFWGHTREKEKIAFEAAMDFISARLKAHPDAHIYHYAHYEETAIKRLAMLHGTREIEVDNLLRGHKLVDLFRVVREGIRTSEPGHSLKNLEVFYMPPREGEVSSADESVVMYERWRKLQDPKLLAGIEDYNRVDCISTLKLREWLLTLRPDGSSWFSSQSPDADEVQRTADREAAERQMTLNLVALMKAPEAERPFRELVGHLLEFHKREAKPDWWFQFKRAEMQLDELIEDSECIGGLERDTTKPPFPDKRSMVHTFSFPPQDFKMRKGQRPRRASVAREPVGEIVELNEETRRIRLKLGVTIPPLGDTLSLIPRPPFDDKVLRAAIYRYAQTIIANNDRYAAVTSVLKLERPRILGRHLGDPVVPTGTDTVAGATAAIHGLDRSHLLVQGPPGAGKTYLSAVAIVSLLRAGRRVGISANSHKAVNRLLEEVAKHAQEQKQTFRAVKKCSEDEHECDAPMVTNVHDNKEVTAKYNLVAGTAWVFADPTMDQALDYLFVDEAGQMSLGHLTAMGLAARNIVLVGDQMQLAQPIKGTHPGDSGQSVLEFLLKDVATVPPDRGVFLDVTWRMHPDVCRFISEAVYEGRLHSHPSCAVRQLVLGAAADPALKPSGLSWVPVVHQECRQKSEEEGARIHELVDNLLRQRWIEAEGKIRPMTLDDILVVSPYNMQVDLLQSLLPAGIRVGTVDKFQGQEAAVVIVSMTASSAEDVPRGMEFLYSRNRINVAVSRAKALAIIVASPRLLEASCSRIEQIALVNILCYAEQYATSTTGSAQ